MVVDDKRKSRILLLIIFSPIWLAPYLVGAFLTLCAQGLIDQLERHRQITIDPSRSQWMLIWLLGWMIFPLTVTAELVAKFFYQVGEAVVRMRSQALLAALAGCFAHYVATVVEGIIFGSFRSRQGPIDDLFLHVMPATGPMDVMAQLLRAHLLRPGNTATALILAFGSLTVWHMVIGLISVTGTKKFFGQVVMYGLGIMIGSLLWVWGVADLSEQVDLSIMGRWLPLMVADLVAYGICRRVIKRSQETAVSRWVCGILAVSSVYIWIVPLILRWLWSEIFIRGLITRLVSGAAGRLDHSFHRAFESQISFRYLMSKKNEGFVSIITVLAVMGVGVGVATLVTTLSIMNGFEEDLKQKILGFQSHVTIRRGDGRAIPSVLKIDDAVRAIPGVIAVAPFIYNEVLMRVPSGEQFGVVIKGVDPTLSKDVVRFLTDDDQLSGGMEDLVDQSDVSPGGAQDGILVGNELAKFYGVGIGDEVTIISPSISSGGAFGFSPRMKRLSVRGSFRTGYWEYDLKSCYITLSAAQELFKIPGEISGVELRVEDLDHAPAIARAIQAMLGGDYEVVDWKEKNWTLVSALKMERKVMSLILFLMISVSALMIVVVLIMLVLEKRREIAILKSMGARAGSLMAIFIKQGFMIGLTGCVLGVVLGWTLSLFLKETQFIQLPGDVYYIDKLPVLIRGGDMVLVAVIAMGITFLATLYPAWQAARLEAAEGLRYE